MASDIKLDEEVIHFEGNAVFAHTPDFMIDCVERRSHLIELTSSPYRRALVHDFQDGLTINWDKDYPGGVTIDGKVKIPMQLSANSILSNNILVTVTISDTTKGGIGGPPIFSSSSETINMGAEILDLRAKIASLQAQIDRLKKI